MQKWTWLSRTKWVSKNYKIYKSVTHYSFRDRKKERPWNKKTLPYSSELNGIRLEPLPFSMVWYKSLFSDLERCTMVGKVRIFELIPFMWSKSRFTRDWGFDIAVLLQHVRFLRVQAMRNGQYGPLVRLLHVVGSSYMLWLVLDRDWLATFGKILIRSIPSALEGVCLPTICLYLFSAHLNHYFSIVGQGIAALFCFQ